MIIYYIIFCLATAVLTCVSVLHPALQYTKSKDVNNLMVANMMLTYAVIVILATMFAPVIFFFLLSKRSTDIMVYGITKSFLE